MTRGEIEQLLARIEAATGPDREIDWSLHETIHGEWLSQHKYQRFGGNYVSAEPPVEGGEHVAGPEYYTSSLDAIVGLIEAQLPGVFWHIAKSKLRASEPLFGAALFFGADEELGHGESVGTAALALCACLLRAKLSTLPGWDE